MSKLSSIFLILFLLMSRYNTEAIKIKYKNNIETLSLNSKYELILDAEQSCGFILNIEKMHSR